MLSWQQNYLNNNLIHQGVVERFGLVRQEPNTPILVNELPLEPVLVHARDLFPELTIPFPSKGLHGFLDLYTWTKGALKRKCYEFNLANFPSLIPYGPWDRKRKVPMKGYCLITIQQDEQYVFHYAGPWKPILKTQLGTYHVQMDSVQIEFTDTHLLNWSGW